MTTVHERGLKEASDSCMENDPTGWAKAVSAYSKNLKTSHYTRKYLDVLFQYDWHTSELASENVFGFALTHASIFNGGIAAVEIDVGSGPLKDSDVDGNNTLLKEIAKPFLATFVGGLGDSDGRLSWAVPIELDVTVGNDDMTQTRTSMKIPPGSAPLEVGYTKISRTMLHLSQERFLARWPYGHDRIALLAVVDVNLMEFGKPVRF